MHAALRPYVTAGIALLGSSLIAVAPMTQPLPDLPVEGLATRLLASSSSIANDLGNLGGLANVPYNVLADIVNIPYYESLALDEYAYALGPGGSVGGVPGWVPPGATVANGGAVQTPAGLLYALGGTGSWYMESVGNTWGWDDGNWPQLAGISGFLLPFAFTEPIAAQLQTLAQAELIDGAAVNCEFECANLLGYFGGWLSFRTPLTSLLSGTTFPTILADTVGQNVGGIRNIAPPPSSSVPGGSDVIWSGQPAQLNLLEPLQAVAANLTGSPESNPIRFPDPATLIQSVIALSNELNYLDFNPSVQGSFLYWGAPTLYSVPAALGGLVQSLTGIPNQFLISPWQPYGAEPVTGYNASLPQLVQGLPQGFEYLLTGLLGYVSPTLAEDLSGPLSALGNLGTVPANLLESSGIANLWTLLTTTLPGALAHLNTQLAQELSGIFSTGSSATGLSSLLSGLGGGLLSTLVKSPSSTAPTGSSETNNTSDMSPNLVPTASSGESNTAAPALVETPHSRSTPGDTQHGTDPTPPNVTAATPAKVTIHASTDVTTKTSNTRTANTSNNGPISTSDNLVGGPLKNLTSDGGTVGSGQSFAGQIHAAVKNALGAANGGGAKVLSPHRR